MVKSESDLKLLKLRIMYLYSVLYKVVQISVSSNYSIPLIIGQAWIFGNLCRESCVYAKMDVLHGKST